MDAMQKANAIFIPLRKRLMELKGNKEGLLAILGTNLLFKVQPDGLEFPKIMEATLASRGVETFRKILKTLVEEGDWNHFDEAITSIPEK